jgi:ABC-2 type transport system ATP-binding protein
MPTVAAAAVEIEDLVVRYGDVVAVSGLSLAAPSGAVTAVLGPNGAGKTTTIETCEGYRKRASGVVRVLGIDPAEGSRALCERVGVMLQSGGVPGSATAAQVLAYTAGLYAHPLAVGPLSRRLGIDAFERTPFRRLSGGEQQKVKLALALVGRPELVFLDEPTAGLDPQARRDTLDLLREVRAAGVSVVLTSHLLDEAEELADHVVIVAAGRAVAAGSPADLVAAHAAAAAGHAPALRFAAAPGLDLARLLAALPSGSSAAEEGTGAYRVAGPGGAVGPDLLAQLTRWCALEGVLATDLTTGSAPAHGGLQAAYLALTNRTTDPAAPTKGARR